MLRRWLYSVAVLLAAAGAALVVPGTADAATTYWHKMTNRRTDMAVNIGYTNGDLNEFAAARQWWNRANDWNNQWDQVPGPNGYVYYKSRWALANGLDFCLTASSIWNSTSVMQKRCTGDRLQQWRIRYDIDTGSQFHRPITNAASGKALTVDDPNDQAGTRLMVFDYYGGLEQHWNIKVVATS